MEDKAYWPALQKIEGIGSITLNALWKELGGARAIWEAETEQLKKIKWLDYSKMEMLIKNRKVIDPEREWNNVKRLNLKLVVMDEKEYPELLRNIHNPPVGLYILGELPHKENSIAIVGSRRPTIYGKRVAEKLGEELAANKIVVVSGMARGIDSFAHQGALKATEGRTVAVLGSGLDIVYPPENKKLFTEISQRGAVISEFPPGTPPDAKNFPQRNRIISGLCWGIIVAEAAQKSGSLITADFAMEQGREVFAVPGPITSPQSFGSNRLLKQGAVLIQSTEDILDEFRLQPLFKTNETKAELSLNEEEKIILERLSWEPVSFETLVEKTGLSAAQVSSAVTFLELKGLASQLPGRRFVSVS